MLRNLYPRVSSLLTAVKYLLMQKKKEKEFFYFIVHTFIRILSCFLGGGTVRAELLSKITEKSSLI